MDALRSLLSEKPAKAARGKKRRAKVEKPAKRASQGPKRQFTAAEILREAELRG